MEESELMPEPVGLSPQHGVQQQGKSACPDVLRCHTGQPQLHVETYPRQELWCHSVAPPCHHFEPRHRQLSSDGDRDGWASQPGTPEDCGLFAGTAASHNGQFGTSRDPCGCRDCQCGATERASGDTRRERECRDRCQESEQELERPLPLRSEIDCQGHGSVMAPYYTHLPMHNQGHATDLHHWAQHGPCREFLYDVRLPCGYPPQPHPVSSQDVGPWMQYPQNWLRWGAESDSHGDAQASFSVNVPQFSLPPAERISQVSVMNLDHLGVGAAPQGEGTLSDPNEKRKTISLPDDCRNIFITYSVDTCAQMVPFAEFLTKQGFRPAIDIFDNPIRRMDINKWMDSYLKDPSVLIIIAISPGYKADIERTGVDQHSQHTKYIYSMMQNEFIQQGSLNYRFVPVLFHHATQSHVPGWLQNTHVYRWPQDKENLVLRLLREEHYIAPPVPKELTLIITPVTLSYSASL